MAKPAIGHGGQVDAHDRTTDIDLQILDLLREGPNSAHTLAGALIHAGEEVAVGTDAVRERLKAMAYRGLVTGTVSGHPNAGAKPRCLRRWPTRGG